MMEIKDLIRENIKSLEAYSSARDEFKAMSSEFVFIDANENPFDTGLNRYPDPQQNLVKAALAKIKNVSIEQLLLGNGSDEVLDFYLDGNEPAYVDMPIWYTHNIKNIGDEILYTNFWINEFYDPNDPDTYFENV